MSEDDNKQSYDGEEEEEENKEEAEERKIIDEEYRIWKKHTPYLYDVVATTALEWPSLTIQWFPDWHSPADKDYSVQRLLGGTHTDAQSGAANHVWIAEVRLPSGEIEREDARGEDSVGGYGVFSGKIEIIQSMPHCGEVHRARYNPHNCNVLCSRGPASLLYVYDKTRHASIPADKQPRPDLVLKGHEQEGYGLVWSTTTEGEVLSGANDSVICMWDINASQVASEDVSPSLSAGIALPSKQKCIDPKRRYQFHTSVVEDVAYHTTSSFLFGSCGDDKKVALWDSRQTAPTQSFNAHNDNVNSLSFNPFSDHIFASASSDKLVHVWDARRITSPLHTLVGHKGEIFCVQWSPFAQDIIASSAADRRIYLWDMNRIGEAQTDEEKEEGPPELLFIHGGHTDRVADMGWNAQPGEEWTMASVADDNVLQVWQVAETVYEQEEKQAAQE